MESRQSAIRAGHKWAMINNQHLTTDTWKPGTSHNQRQRHTISTRQPTPDKPATNNYDRQEHSTTKANSRQPTVNNLHEENTAILGCAQQPFLLRFQPTVLLRAKGVKINASFVTNLKPITTDRQNDIIQYIFFRRCFVIIVYKPEFDNPQADKTTFISKSASDARQYLSTNYFSNMSLSKSHNLWPETFLWFWCMKSPLENVIE
jgi:hypothetical protein